MTFIGDLRQIAKNCSTFIPKKSNQHTNICNQNNKVKFFCSADIASQQSLQITLDQRV